MITKGILGIKGTTEQVFDNEGNRMPVTSIHTSPCYVVSIKSMDADGYWSVQLGFGEAKKIKKSAQGLFKKAGIKTPLRFLKEVRFSEGELIEDGKKKGLRVGDLELWVGQVLKASELFAIGELVTITGTSKGKGFQGVMKRHGFHGGPASHGQSDRDRAPGSIGMSATPGRVYKGKKMAGRMGSDTITVKNLVVVEVTEEMILVKGLLPGIPGGLIVIRSKSDLPELVTEETPVEDVAVEQEVPAEKPAEDNKVEEPKNEVKVEEKLAQDNPAKEKVEEKKD